MVNLKVKQSKTYLKMDHLQPKAWQASLVINSSLDQALAMGLSVLNNRKRHNKAVKKIQS